VRILFLHDNFPGQFRDLAPALAKAGHEVVFGTSEPNGELPRVRKAYFGRRREPSRQLHRYLVDLERAVLSGQGAYRMAKRLEAEGFVPDVVYGHSGWGSTLYMKDAFPDAKLICYFDWYYRPRGANGDFFPQWPMNADRGCFFRARNATSLLDLAHCDWGVVTTEWQLSQYPRDALGKLSLLHDGIDTGFWRPEADGRRARYVHRGLDLGAPELVTYGTRGMDPYRGFDVFLRAVELLHRRRPQLVAAVAGDDRIPYGSKPPEGSSWKEYMLGQLDLDRSRIHFLGAVPKLAMRQLLRAGHAHVYFSAPFIPSWSLFEAMSTGALVVGSRTAPCEELITDGHNGLLSDFFDHVELADRIEEAIERQAELAPLRETARATIDDERFALRSVLARQIRLIDDVRRGAGPTEIEASVADRVRATARDEGLAELSGPQRVAPHPA